jgi:hypothetical protein
MVRLLRRAAVMAVAVGAFFVVQPAFAASGCSGDAVSGLASPAQLSPSEIAKHGGT